MILSVITSLMFQAGYTAMESPEWTPVRSMCSIMPGIRMSSPSQMASTSSSVPIRYLSIKMGFSISCAKMMAIYSLISASLKAMIMFWPPST